MGSREDGNRSFGSFSVMPQHKGKVSIDLCYNQQNSYWGEVTDNMNAGFFAHKIREENRET